MVSAALRTARKLCELDAVQRRWDELIAVSEASCPELSELMGSAEAEPWPHRTRTAQREPLPDAYCADAGHGSTVTTSIPDSSRTGAGSAQDVDPTSATLSVLPMSPTDARAPARPALPDESTARALK